MSLLADSTRQPPKIVLNAVEGFGKTTMGAFTESPLMLMFGGEDGYLELGHQGLVPDVPHILIERWEQVEPVLQQVLEACPYSTIVLDSLTTLEQLAHEFVCNTQFGGDWSETGFLGFYRGPAIAVNLISKILNRLDDIRRKHNVMVMVLSHADSKLWKNPLGEDFDRYISSVNQRTWAITRKWCSALLFGNFLTVVDKKTKKGVGGTTRTIYTERTDGYDAKNRHNLPHRIDIPNDPKTAWAKVWSHFSGAK